MSDSHMTVQKDLLTPITRKVMALFRFVYSKLHDVLVGSIALVLMWLATLYIVLPHAGGPLIGMPTLALFGFGFVLWITMDNIFHGEMSFEFIIAGSIVVGLALTVGFAFAVVGMPFIITLAFCAALALAGWLAFMPILGIFGLAEWLDERANEHYLKTARVRVYKAGRFVVTPFQHSTGTEDPTFNPDEPEYVLEDTQTAQYFEFDSEFAAYRMIDRILMEEQAAARRQPKASQSAA